MRDAFARAFEEWLKRYNADPAKFADAYGEPTSYGDGCADYFVKLLNELAAGQPWDQIAKS